MSLTAPEMKRLEDDARDIASDNCRGYLSDAQECLRSTRDPIAPLELLRAMWGGSQARRPEQIAALADAGQWIEDRLVREPGISPERLELELGWLRRLVVIHRPSDDFGRDQHGNARPPRTPTFGAHIEQLRQRRKRALELIAAAATAAAATAPPARSADTARKADSPATARAESPERLPDSFEVRIINWKDALTAFKTARDRRKKQKDVKDRVFPVETVVAALRPLATDIACSLLDTRGMDELEKRTVANAGNMPSFWIALADLAVRDGKRIAGQISFETAPPRSSEGAQQQ